MPRRTGVARTDHFGQGRNRLRRERPGHTLQPTALIHEAYLRLVDQKVPEWQNRAHFFSVASQIMRQILVDFARSKSAAKRGGVLQVTLDDSLAVVGARAEEFLALHEGLERLKGFDERKARVIEMRYFGGMTREEVAEAMGLTLATVKRDLMLGEAWLRKELGAGELPPRD